MSHALILEYYDELAETENLAKFARKVGEKYTEGTLQRLLCHSDFRTRQAALAALRLRGTIRINKAVAECLRDPDPRIVEAAENTLWAIWYRADAPGNNKRLHQIAELIADQEYAQALTSLNELIRRAPRFAEAYNQRAILHWQWGNYKSSIDDCLKVLKLNPLHFGAAAGLGQCYVQLKKPADALKAFRLAQRIHPNLNGVAESIAELQERLRDQRREDRT